MTLPFNAGGMVLLVALLVVAVIAVVQLVRTILEPIRRRSVRQDSEEMRSTGVDK